MLERASFGASLGLGDVGIGDTLLVESPSGKQRTMRIAGSVHDMSQLPAFMNGAGYGYIDFETLAWLDEPRDYNQLVFVVRNKSDMDHINDVAKLIEKRMESSGVNVLFCTRSYAGEHLKTSWTLSR